MPRLAAAPASASFRQARPTHPGSSLSYVHRPCLKLIDEPDRGVAALGEVCEPENGLPLFKLGSTFSTAPSAAREPCSRHGLLEAVTVGNVMLNTEPSPGRLSTETVPPCASTICLTMASPRPAPPLERARDFSTR